MEKLKTLRVLEEEFGKLAKSPLSGESVYYSARWEEVASKARAVAKQQKIMEPGDIRVADYALELLGIPCHYAEAGMDERGNWLLYWR